MKTFRDTILFKIRNHFCYAGILCGNFFIQIVFNKLKRTAGAFNSYITEGDGIRNAAADGCSVYAISGANAERQSRQFMELVEELLTKL